MFLYIIRHGDPDYEKDCLTERGVRQAALTAGRLMLSGIDRIYSSPYGRAQETARFLSERAALPVITVDWARELGSDCTTTYPDGVEKGTGILPSTHLHRKDILSMDEERFFRTVPGICDSNLYGRYKEIGAGLDVLLEENGYSRTPEGFYAPVSPNRLHLALFCHGAMIRSVVSHLIHIPYACLCTTLHENHCGITVFRFRELSQEPLVPELLSFGDIGHLYAGDGQQNFYLTGEPF